MLSTCGEVQRNDHCKAITKMRWRAMSTLKLENWRSQRSTMIANQANKRTITPTKAVVIYNQPVGNMNLTPQHSLQRRMLGWITTIDGIEWISITTKHIQCNQNERRRNICHIGERLLDIRTHVAVSLLMNVIGLFRLISQEYKYYR